MQNDGTVEQSRSDANEPVVQDGAGAVHYDDIGGHAKALGEVREMVELPLRHPEVFKRLGIQPPKGVLLYGPPGTGKTLLAKALASECDVEFIQINGPEIMAKFHGESESNLRNKFEEARRKAPSILFIDELDSIAPKRDDTSGDVERRVVAQLLTSMDGLESRGDVVVIGATNRVNAVDAALRRGGRFDKEIELGVPNEDERLEILRIHTRTVPLAEDVDLEEIARSIHGFVGADIANLCKEACLEAVREFFSDWKTMDRLSEEALEGLFVHGRHFQQAAAAQHPSVLREFNVEVPAVRWSDIGGCSEAVRELREAVEWPLKYPELFAHHGTRPPKGILLYGPTGTGKTTIAKAVATESEANFISIKGTEFFSKWVGESEKAARELFKKARLSAPCIVFIDEIDTIGSIRFSDRGDSGVAARVLSQILAEMDGLVELNDVVVIGATNRPDLIDPGLIRSGRFDRLIRIELPNETDRRRIFIVHTRHKPLDGDVDIDLLVAKTDGMTGADIATICMEASMSAIRRFVEEQKSQAELTFSKIMMKDLLKGLHRVRPEHACPDRSGDPIDHEQI